MSKEIRIKKDNVELIIPFTDNADLATKLEGSDKIFEIVQKKLGSSISYERKIGTDLKGICEIQNNFVILHKKPKSPLHTVILTIYAYGPLGANNDEISITTGIDAPSRKIITPTYNKKYFRKLKNDNWGLSDTGMTQITKILKEIKGDQNATS